MSGNHNQSLDRALSIVDAAANAGADAQITNLYCRYNDFRYKGDFFIDDPKSLWKVNPCMICIN